MFSDSEDGLRSTVARMANGLEAGVLSSGFIVVFDSGTNIFLSYIRYILNVWIHSYLPDSGFGG